MLLGVYARLIRSVIAFVPLDARGPPRAVVTPDCRGPYLPSPRIRVGCMGHGVAAFRERRVGRSGVTLPTLQVVELDMDGFSRPGGCSPMAGFSRPGSGQSGGFSRPGLAGFSRPP